MYLERIRLLLKEVEEATGIDGFINVLFIIVADFSGVQLGQGPFGILPVNFSGLKVTQTIVRW